MERASISSRPSTAVNARATRQPQTFSRCLRQFRVNDLDLSSAAPCRLNVLNRVFHRCLALCSQISSRTRNIVSTDSTRWRLKVAFKSRITVKGKTLPCIVLIYSTSCNDKLVHWRTKRTYKNFISVSGDGLPRSWIPGFSTSFVASRCPSMQTGPAVPAAVLLRSLKDEESSLRLGQGRLPK